MPLDQLNSTDAFVVVDIPDVPAAGIARCARKILTSSAGDLARHATYVLASFGHRVSGASAGINAEGEGADGAIEAFVAELMPRAAAGTLLLGPGKGVTAEALAPLTAAATEGRANVWSDDILAAGVAAATGWALGGLDGRRVVIEGPAPAPIAAALTAAGAEIVTVEGAEAKPWLIWGAEVDAILAGSKPGTLTHQGAGSVKAVAIVPWAPIPITTKAFAMLRRAGVTVVPDFVSAAGGLLAGVEHTETGTEAVAKAVTAVLEEVGDHRDGPLIGACLRAEAFLASWTDVKLFGRPLAA